MKESEAPKSAAVEQPKAKMQQMDMGGNDEWGDNEVVDVDDVQFEMKSKPKQQAVRSAPPKKKEEKPVEAPVPVASAPKEDDKKKDEQSDDYELDNDWDMASEKSEKKPETKVENKGHFEANI